MTIKLSMDLSEWNIVPEQKYLEDKVGCLGRIISISARDVNDRCFRGNIQVGVEDKSGIIDSQCALTLTPDDFRKFLSDYNVAKPQYLVGKPVISIYNQYPTGIICGLMAVNLDK
jgi:hypothetical protein